LNRHAVLFTSSIATQLILQRNRGFGTIVIYPRASRSTKRLIIAFKSVFIMSRPAGGALNTVLQLFVEYVGSPRLVVRHNKYILLPNDLEKIAENQLKCQEILKTVWYKSQEFHIRMLGSTVVALPVICLFILSWLVNQKRKPRKVDIRCKCWASNSRYHFGVQVFFWKFQLQI